MREAAHPIHVVSDASDVSRDAAERLRDTQTSPNRLDLQRARPEPPDTMGLLGAKRSRGQARHESRMLGIYWAGRESAYAFTVGTAIEHTAIQTGTRFAKAVEDELSKYSPDSLTGAFCEMLTLDSLGRVRGLASDAMNEYKSRTLGS